MTGVLGPSDQFPRTLRRTPTIGALSPMPAGSPSDTQRIELAGRGRSHRGFDTAVSSEEDGLASFNPSYALRSEFIIQARRNADDRCAGEAGRTRSAGVRPITAVDGGSIMAIDGDPG
jgi:hypothetical protein